MLPILLSSAIIYHLYDTLLKLLELSMNLVTITELEQHKLSKF